MDRIELRLQRAFNTYMLQINFNDLSETYMQKYFKKGIQIKSIKYCIINDWTTLDRENSTVGTGRIRHRRQQSMLVTMLFGVTALGAVVVPLGFQLLSVVSGKALLLAKMALLLASINGLKRVRNYNNININYKKTK